MPNLSSVVKPFRSIAMSILKLLDNFDISLSDLNLTSIKWSKDEETLFLLSSFLSGPNENPNNSNFDLSCSSSIWTIRSEVAWSWKSAEKYPIRIFLLVWCFDIGSNLFLFEYVFFTHISAVFFCNSGKSYNVVTEKGTVHNAKVIAIAGGLGSFESRKPQIDNINKYEGNGVEYMVKNPKLFKNKIVIISGGGDSALDWTIELQKIARKVTLVHRRTEFRGAYDSIEKVQKLKNAQLIDVITPAEVIELKGEKKLESVNIKLNGSKKEINTDFFIPLFGLIPKLGKISDWGLEIRKNAICVNNALDYQTNIPGIFAIGDINTYPGKLKLILCGFHEATLMCQAAFKIIHPNKKNILRYTTVTGVNGFDGSKRKSESATIKSIEW